MVVVLPLQHHAQLTVIQALLDHLDNIDENQIKYIVKLFQTQSFTPVSEQVLKRLVTYYPHKLTNQILTALVPPHARQLVLKSCTSVSFKGLSETLKKCKHLQFLDLTQCPCLMLPDLFTYAGLISPSLTSITVEHCDTVTDEVVQAMLQGVSALQHLNVSGCLNLTDKVFLLNEKLQGTREAFSSVRPVMDYECHLVSVDISGCRKLTNTAIRHLCTLSGPTLKSVNISWILADCTALLYLSGYEHLAVSCVLSLFDVVQQAKSKDKFSHILREILQDIHNLVDNYSSEPRAQMLRQLVTVKDEVDTASLSNLSAKTQAKISDINNVPIEEEEEKTANTVKNQEAHCNKPSSLEDTDCIVSHENVNVEFENLIEESDTKQLLQAENLHLSPFEGSTIANCFSKKQMTSCFENDVCISLYHEEKVQLEINVGEGDSLLVTMNDQDSEMKEFINLGNNNAGTGQMDGASEANGDTGSTLLAENGSASLFTSFGEVPSVGENVTDEELPNISHNLDTCLFSLSVDDAVLSTEEMSTLSQKHETLNSSLTDAISSMDRKKIPVISSKGIGSVDDDFLLSVNNLNVVSKEMDTIDSYMYEDIRNSSSAENNMSRSFDEPKTVDCFGAHRNSSLQDCDISGIKFSSGDVIQDPDVISHDTVEPLSFQNIEDTAVLTSFVCIDPSRNQNNGTSKPAVDNSVFTSPILRIMNSVDGSIFQKQDSIASSFSITELETVFRQIYVPELSSLDMTDITFHNKSRDEFCLQVFFEINKSIKKFGISWKELSDETLDRISASSPALHEIMLVECGYLSTPGISNLGLNCRQLQKIDLTGVSFIGDRAVAPLLTLAGLESLVLSGSEITDKTLYTISEGRCALKSLHLKKCPATDLSVTLLAENCPYMKVLVISSVSDITDASVIYLSEHLHQLHELDISWNLALTNESVSAVLKNCPRLHTACMSGLKQITAEPFLPIITDLKRWRRCQSLLRFKLHEKKILEENNEENYSSDEEFEELYLPHRSQVYTPNLRTLLLEYSDLVNDTQLSEIVAVCRGSLQIIDYYGEQMKPALIHYKKGKQYLSPQM
ncbi:hypothetical protein ACJMK2_025465 [Sinanodonta woodiana]|uniref:F-box/LRR-repeat protein 15-like leucin rich repeat domain-containing protein n=1 Tax=Sinanodonta woodiana TaxID=1069815 RepID=A0ABD3XH45_SINWO